jgi:hypothetical protein
MEQKITCEVVKDLLPLYVDNIVSEESKKLVQEHLNGCEECRKYHRDLTGETILTTEISHNDKDALKKIRKKIKGKRIKAACLSAIITIAIFAGLFYGLIIRESYVSYEDSGLYVEDNILKSKSNYSCYYGFDAPGNEIEFIYLTTTAYKGKGSREKVVELQNLKNNTSTIKKGNGKVEKKVIKEIYYLSKEDAKMVSSPGFWSENKQEKEAQLNELKSLSKLVWRAE